MRERPGRWIAEPTGATSHLPKTSLYLTDHGLQPDPDRLNVNVCSPAHCGADAGEYCAIWLGPEMPGDQRHDDALSATFDTAPLDADMDIVGAPQIFLRLASDRPQGQIAIRLNHIHPDGASARITYGVLNLCHRKDAEHPEDMPLNAPVEIALDLDHIAYRVPKGHQLRVSISTAYWPLLWPAPDSPTLTLTQGSLALPLRPTTGGDEYTFAPPVSAPGWQAETLRAENHIRRQETDRVTGNVALVIEDDFGKMRDIGHGLVTGSTARETWVIHPDDPLSAKGSCHWTEELERDDIRLRTETRSEIWSDATHFHLSARVDAYENNKLIYERSLVDSIKRRFM